MGKHIDNRYESKRYEREKLESLAKDSSYFGAYYDEEKERYIKLNKGKRSKFLKRISNKKIRKEGDLPNNPHKVYDYDWEMW